VAFARNDVETSVTQSNLTRMKLSRTEIPTQDQLLIRTSSCTMLSKIIGTLNLLTKKQNSIIRSSCRNKNATPRTRRSEFAIFIRYKPDRYALEFFAHRPAEKYCFSSPYWIPKTVDLNLRKRRSQFRFCLGSLDQTIFPFSELRCHISDHCL
jgi:hypothetical protein